MFRSPRLYSKNCELVKRFGVLKGGVVLKSTQPVTGPLARNKELTVEHLLTETVVYDHQRHRVHCLNQTLAFVWQQCDGHTSVQEMAARLPDALNLPADYDIILVALRKLKKIHLLTGDLPDLASNGLPSRRELVQRLAAFGTAAAALIPAATTIVAPTPSMALSQDTHAPSGNGNGNGKGRGVGEQNSNGHGHPHQ
jgi:hypothetical protein